MTTLSTEEQDPDSLDSLKRGDDDRSISWGDIRCRKWIDNTEVEYRIVRPDE